LNGELLKNDELHVLRCTVSILEDLRKTMGKYGFLAEGLFVFLAHNTIVS
jgi:hypothetical protein